MFLFSLAKLLVLLLIILWLLLLMGRRMIMREITRMRLIKIRTTCNHQHHKKQYFNDENYWLSLFLFIHLYPPQNTYSVKCI